MNKNQKCKNKQHLSQGGKHKGQGQGGRERERIWSVKQMFISQSHIRFGQMREVLFASPFYLNSVLAYLLHPLFLFDRKTGLLLTV